jgi:predicted  nucleic acid-binding Zn-ribbon protein
LADWQAESTQEKLTRLRRELKAAQDELIDAEALLADHLAEITAFERRVETILGPLIDRLARLEQEVHQYNQRMQQLRNRQAFGADHVSVEEQFRRTWQVPPAAAPTPPLQPLTPADEKMVKRLYRQLAQRFHPDLASNPAEQAYRTEKMAAVNDAYAARSLAELQALANEPLPASVDPAAAGRTDSQMIEALQAELGRVHRRLRQIEFEKENAHNRASVQLSLEVKLAWRYGRDLLAEMAAELEGKVARKSAERDFLKAQFDQIGPDPIIRPDR